MNTFNLEAAAEQSLRLLAEGGASVKTVRGYLHTGFGVILRHFTNQGISDVSICMLDAFVLEQRAHFEQGGFSEWKWQLIRRGSEILKHFVLTDTSGA